MAHLQTPLAYPFMQVLNIAVRGVKIFFTRTFMYHNKKGTVEQASS